MAKPGRRAGLSCFFRRRRKFEIPALFCQTPAVLHEGAGGVVACFCDDGSGGFAAGHEEDGFVVEAGGSESGLDGDLLLDVDVFRTDLDAEGGVFPDAEFDPRFEPCDAEAAARFVQWEHVGDEEFDAQKVVDFSIGEGVLTSFSTRVQFSCTFLS